MSPRTQLAWPVLIVAVALWWVPQARAQDDLDLLLAPKKAAPKPPAEKPADAKAAEKPADAKAAAKPADAKAAAKPADAKPAAAAAPEPAKAAAAKAAPAADELDALLKKAPPAPAPAPPDKAGAASAAPKPADAKAPAPKPPEEKPVPATASAGPPASPPASPPAGEPAEPLAGRLFTTLHVGLLVPSGRPAATTGGDGLQPWARRAVTFPLTLQVGYRLPFLKRTFAVVAEAGWFPLASDGGRIYPQDPDFSTLAWHYTGNQMPLLIGVEAHLPGLLPGVLKRIRPQAGVSFAAVFSRVVSTYLVEGVRDAPQSGWALGFALTGGAALKLGPGEITAEVRYVNARTDLGLQSAYPGQPWNADKGDVEGMNYLFGYRLSFLP